MLQNSLVIREKSTVINLPYLIYISIIDKKCELQVPYVILCNLIAFP